MTATWYLGTVPAHITVRQIYGIVFSHDGRILLMKDGNTYSLAGGTPEAEDNGIEETLRRELIEEVNVQIDTPYIVGYRLIDEENSTEPYAQVRMASLMAEIMPAKPDPATGRTYKRYLVSPSKAIELLNWQDDGAAQINSAVDVARNFLGLSSFDNNEILEV